MKKTLQELAYKYCFSKFQRIFPEGPSKADSMQEGSCSDVLTWDEVLELKIEQYVAVPLKTAIKRLFG